MRRRSTPQAWALRCRIILACAEGASNKDVAAQLSSTPQAVGRWRSRFVQYRIAGLGDMPRPGGPRTVTDEQVAAVVTRTLESTPKNATRWSTWSMAKEMGLSQSSVSRIWRAFGLQPHRSETFKLLTDPYFVDKVHDVVGLYLDPLLWVSDIFAGAVRAHRRGDAQYWDILGDALIDFDRLLASPEMRRARLPVCPRSPGSTSRGLPPLTCSHATGHIESRQQTLRARYESRMPSTQAWRCLNS